MGNGLARSIQYAAWRAVSAILVRLPASLGYGVAVIVGTIGYYVWPRGRRAMLANYRRVIPEARPAERKRIARRSLVNYCKYLVDFVRFPNFSPESVIEAVSNDGAFEGLETALKRSNGAVIVCMHFGNWDAGAGATAARGFPVTVVAQTFADPRLDAMVVGARERLGMRIVKMEKLGPSLFRVLKANELLALLIDRAVPGEGVKVQFFGEEVEVPAGPARFALRSGATVVPSAFPRISPYRPNVATLCDFIIPERTGDDERDVTELTQAIMNSHERFIREYPDQWYMFRPMWIHRDGMPSR